MCEKLTVSLRVAATKSNITSITSQFNQWFWIKDCKEYTLTCPRKFIIDSVPLWFSYFPQISSKNAVCFLFIFYFFVHSSNHLLWNFDNGKSGDWRIYWATAANWHQMWIWFKDGFKGFMVEIEILPAISDGISNQQLNLLLFLSD